MNPAIASVHQIDGELTTLRPIYLVDYDDFRAAIEESEEPLHRYMPFDQSPESTRAFLQETSKRYKEGTALDLGIYEQGTATLCGTIGLNRFDPFTPRCTVGYWIRSSKTGRGYATDALLALVAAAASTLGLARLDAEVATDNVASHRVLTKAGFVHEGDKMRALKCHGVWQDLRLYGRVLVFDAP